MKKKISYKIVSLVFSVLVVCFAIAFYAVAWTEPSSAPPGGSVDAPVNVGDTLQTKSGGLGISGPFRAWGGAIGADDGLTVSNGNVGIGTISPSWKLDVNGIIKASGIRSSGTIIITNTNNLIWGSASGVKNIVIASGDLAIRAQDGIGDEIIRFNYNTGDVGIGTVSPDEKFEIEWVDGGTDAEIGRGINDTDVTFLALRSPNGTKWYLYPADDGTLVVTETKP